MKTNQESKRRQNVSAQIKPDIMEQVEYLSEKDRRTKSQMIEILLEIGLKHYKKS